MFPFLIRAENLPFEEAAQVGQINMWRIVFFYGFFTAIAVFVAFWRKFFRGVAVMLVLFWSAGTAFVVLINTMGPIQTNTSFASNEEVVTDINSCREEGAVEMAKYCTYLVYRDDGGHGSGFSTRNGYLVTNKHVIEGANKLTTWINGEEREITVWNYSPTLDVAVLKLPEDVATCKWFDSSRLRTAESLFAVGWPNQPNGDSTVTKGIYSRTNTFEDGLEFIQTDAPVNPGNSGGPLLNKCGVVGVNTLKETWANDIPLEGLGNALSSKLLIPLVDQLIKDGGNTSIPKTQQAYQQINPNIPNNSPTLDVSEIRTYLNRLYTLKRSWENGYSRYPKEDMDRLMDSFTRQISFCETLISRLEGGKKATQDDLFMWDAVVKMSYESAAITNKLNGY